MGDRTDSPTDEHRTVDNSPDNAMTSATGAYETGTGTVLYDMDNPLAWVQGDNAVRLAEMA